MRGFPPIQIFLIALAFGVLAFPLAHLTRGGQMHASAALENVAMTGKGADTPAQLRLRYAHKPLSVRLTLDGQDLLKNADFSESPTECEVRLRISPDGDEIALEAEWPEGTPDTALSIEIEPDGHEMRTQTCWSSGSSMSELLLFQW